MSASLLAIDLLGIILAILGVLMAFRPATFRRLMRMPPPAARDGEDGPTDPLTYLLRIAGVMILMFGIVLAGMFTLVYGV